MNNIILSPRDRLLEAQKASRELLSVAKAFAQEQISHGLRIATGHMRRFTRTPLGGYLSGLYSQSNAAVYAVASGIYEPAASGFQSTYSQLVSPSNGIFQRNHSVIIPAGLPLAGLSAKFANDNIILAQQFVSRDMAKELDFQIAHQKDAVSRVMKGSYIGPLIEPEQNIADAFRRGGLCEKSFTTQALGLRGVTVSDSCELAAVSQERFATLADGFNQTGLERSTAVLTFRSATMHTSPMREAPVATRQLAFNHA